MSLIGVDDIPKNHDEGPMKAKRTPSLIAGTLEMKTENSDNFSWTVWAPFHFDCSSSDCVLGTLFQMFIFWIISQFPHGWNVTAYFNEDGHKKTQTFD